MISDNHIIYRVTKPSRKMLRQDKKNHQVVKLNKQGALRDRKARKLSKKQSEIIESTAVESKGKFEIKLKFAFYKTVGKILAMTVRKQQKV